MVLLYNPTGIEVVKFQIIWFQFSNPYQSKNLQFLTSSGLNASDTSRLFQLSDVLLFRTSTSISYAVKFAGIECHC